MDRGGRSSGGGSSSRDREDRDRGSFRGDKRDNRDRDRGNRSDRFDRGADRADRDRGDRDRDRRSRRNRKKEGDDDYPLITPTMILGAKPLVRPVEAAQGVPTASPQQQHQHQQLYQPPQQSSIMGSLPNRTLYTPPSGVPTTPGTPPHPSTASAAAQRTPMLARSPAGAPTAAAMTSPSVASQARTKSPSKQVSPQHQQQQQPALGDIRVLRQINPAKRPLFQQQNPRAIKFINDKLEIALESVMKILSDTNDFSVVGVLGYQGVGKSTVANELCGKSPFFDTAHTADGSETTIVPAEHHSMDDVPFNVQRPEHWIEARHETNGIDIYVTPERLIVLDVQPLFSSSILYQAFLKDSKMSTDVMSYENFVDQMSIQLGIFIFSICHVVLIVQEDLFDTRMLKFVQTMRMLQSGVPNACSNILSMPASSSSTASQPQAAPILSPSTAGSAASAAAATTTSSASQQLHQQSTATITIPQPLVSAEYVPEIVFVYNKASEKQFSAHCVDEVQNFLDLYFENTPFRKNGFIHPFSWAEVQPAGGANDAASTSSSSTAPLSTTMTTKKHAAGGVNFFILPFNNSNKRSSASNHDSMKNPISLLPARDSYETLSKTLRMLISSLPKKPFERNVSEKEWVQNAYRLWAIIMKSSKFLSEYNRTFQKLQLYKT